MTDGTVLLLMESLGWNCKEKVEDFLFQRCYICPHGWPFSMAHLHHLVKQFKINWFSGSPVVTTAASSAIFFPKTKGFLIGIIYRPLDTSKHLPEDFNENFDSMLTTVFSENKECILTGDINCNYLEKSDQKVLKSILVSYGLKQLLGAPTRITKETKILIDVIWASKYCFS